MSMLMSRVTMEQTDLVLPGGCRYRTVSVESSDVDEIRRMLEKPADVRGSSRGKLAEVLSRLGGVPMGYPQFVVEHYSSDS